MYSTAVRRYLDSGHDPCASVPVVKLHAKTSGALGAPFAKIVRTLKRLVEACASGCAESKASGERRRNGFGTTDNATKRQPELLSTLAA
jgi:hypothetical protein